MRIWRPPVWPEFSIRAAAAAAHATWLFGPNYQRGRRPGRSAAKPLSACMDPLPALSPLACPGFDDAAPTRALHDHEWSWSPVSSRNGW